MAADWLDVHDSDCGLQLLREQVGLAHWQVPGAPEPTIGATGLQLHLVGLACGFVLRFPTLWIAHGLRRLVWMRRYWLASEQRGCYARPSFACSYFA